ncbi:FadR/GntR family transcriptional regulator [Pararobbsia alpina]|uniref:L-lactate dehydrogenase operon regulatory protein n=1 Tax=Pararobbsia alpina TaxID=621374 RepID=A0A6S7B8H8_9BURK|nr:FadR/GntR family transcriptional regulator [Pararobbsia alpina]CAB3791444.1 Putative L-lactate dehydrogenase operon regulatory protein [Pararobbsia alpina]
MTLYSETPAPTGRDPRPASLVEQAVQRLAANIVAGLYAGTTLPTQDELAREFDVSRTVMREALSMLVSRGMLDVRTKTGTRARPMREWQVINRDVVEWRFLRTPDDAFMRDVIEFRTEIEVRAARLAAERGTPEELVAIRAAFDAFRQYKFGDPEFFEMDEQLHAAILKASHNRFFDQMAPIVRAALGLVAKAERAAPALGDEVIELHRRVVVAIEARDPVAAEATMRALLAHTATDVEYLITQK